MIKMFEKMKERGLTYDDRLREIGRLALGIQRQWRSGLPQSDQVSRTAMLGAIGGTDETIHTILKKAGLNWDRFLKITGIRYGKPKTLPDDEDFSITVHHYCPVELF